jgi:predicted enzyme involved in methoxymalonyl-ACP biosynthesis
MSCRIFSRSAEQYILRGLLGIAAKAGASRVIGEYLPTAKNAVVADLYPGSALPRPGAPSSYVNSPPAWTIW